jgi:hypothetical protein
MFLTLAIQVTNYSQSVNKRVVAEMTWKSQEGASMASSLFWGANFFTIGGECSVERMGNCGEAGPPICTAFSVIRPLLLFRW